MTYRIRYEYQSGDSFGRRDEEGTLEMTWEDKTVAQANLLRIKEHYRYYEAVDSRHRNYAEDLAIIGEAPTKDWYVASKRPHDYSHHSIILKTDEGKDWQFSCPWCGYFETLYGASIIEDTDKDSFDLR